MIKTSKVLLAGLLLSTSAYAELPTKSMNITAKHAVDDGHVHGYVRLHQIFSGKSNGYDKDTGSVVGFGLKYGLEVLDGLRVGAEYYGSKDTGLTKTNRGTAGTGVAFGMMMNEFRTDYAYGGSFGAHISYQATKELKLEVARSEFKSPLTKVPITFVPNMYEFAQVSAKTSFGKVNLAFMDRMSYGSRSATDWGLIGEFTGTAGMYISPLATPGSTVAPAIKRGDFYKIDETIKGANSSSGIAILGYENKFNNLKISAWDFRALNILNNFYASVDYKIPAPKGVSTTFSAQVLNQSVDSGQVDGTTILSDKYGGTMYGLQAAVKIRAFTVKASVNSKDDKGFLNAWGADPGYTSSIFSRNEYRSNVKAYKLFFSYKIMKGLKLMAGYANYGKSDMYSAKYKVNPTTDATEADVVVVYKPMKNVMLKLFNASRTSEYDTATTDRTQNHTRLIANYKF